jgi:molecular chaperone IbpA
MRTFDLTPLYRSAIGFDRLANLLETRAETAPTYPPYNIELVSEDQYRIVMALAGFDRSELDITTERDSLVVTGRKQ